MSEPVEPQTEGASGGMLAGTYYGHGLPYLPIDGYPGKLIVLEGTDGVGRSTQIRLLREWLEVQGYGVVDTGSVTSLLMQPTMDLAKASNTLNKLTFVLLYATEFADRLEREIIPALKAGFIVLTDRYIFTALSRAGVRGIDPAWLRKLYGFAIAPHLVFYLRVDVDTLSRRVLAAGGMDYWESGMDMKSGDDIYDSFRAYQVKLLREYKVLAREFGFRVLDARCSIDEIQAELRRQVGAFLAQSAQRSPSNAETPAEDDVERPAEPLQIRTQPPAEIEAVAAPERGSPRRRHHA
jgi:dTMP kinase